MLLISIRTIADIKVVHCAGRIRTGNETVILSNFVTSLLCENHDVVLDLDAVNHIDSSFLSTLSNIGDLANALGRQIRVVNLGTHTDDRSGLTDSVASPATLRRPI